MVMSCRGALCVPVVNPRLKSSHRLYLAMQMQMLRTGMTDISRISRNTSVAPFFVAKHVTGVETCEVVLVSSLC